MDDMPLIDNKQSSQQRCRGYDRIMGNISWLLVALMGQEFQILANF